MKDEEEDNINPNSEDDNQSEDNSIDENQEENERQKKCRLRGFLKKCGERGIRTPGGLTLNGFQDRRDRPLCHFSGAKVNYFLF